MLQLPLYNMLYAEPLSQPAHLPAQFKGYLSAAAAASAAVEALSNEAPHIGINHTSDQWL